MPEISGLLENRLEDQKNNRRNSGKSHYRIKKYNEKAEYIINNQKEERPETGKGLLSGKRGEEKDSVEDIDRSVLNEDDIEELNYLESLQSDEQEKKQNKKNSVLNKIGQIIMVFLCVYLIILIYGVAITEFAYNEDGEVAPTILSVDEIREKSEFESLAGVYIQARNLYEKMLILDYRVGERVEEPATIVPEYQALMDDIDALSKQIEGADINSRYNQIRSMIYTLVNNHYISYCQYISIAITENNAEAETQALLARQAIKDNFALITENMIKIGSGIKGYDISYIIEWSPEGYVREYTGSID